MLTNLFVKQSRLKMFANISFSPCYAPPLLGNKMGCLCNQMINEEVLVSLFYRSCPQKADANRNDLLRLR